MTGTQAAVKTCVDCGAPTCNGIATQVNRRFIKLLEPGLGMLADLTEGRPVLGVVPYLKDLRIAQEDSVFLDTHRVLGQAGPSQETVDIAVIWFPHMSNYDDYDALSQSFELEPIERSPQVHNDGMLVRHVAAGP